MPKHYTHLSPSERCQIAALLQRGDSQRSIAGFLGRAASTVRREIARNCGGDVYSHAAAHGAWLKRRMQAGLKLRTITPAIVALIEERLISFQWSPVQISGRLRAEQGICVSHEWIYRHIWADKRAGGRLWKQLRHSGKKYNKRNGMNTGRGVIQGRVDIDHRPKVAGEKSRIGDWEIDTVIGQGHRGLLVTAVDRMSKYTIIEAVANKSARTVTKALIRRLRVLKDRVITITADNGKEFSHHEKLSKALDADVYFAKPYQSWQRGLNEHTNGLIRQYFPKTMALNRVSPENVDKIERLLNNRPRKCLNFKTPQEVFSKPPPSGALQC
jgi:transposase, IS30 family